MATPNNEYRNTMVVTRETNHDGMFPVFTRDVYIILGDNQYKCISEGYDYDGFVFENDKPDAICTLDECISSCECRRCMDDDQSITVNYNCTVIHRNNIRNYNPWDEDYENSIVGDDANWEIVESEKEFRVHLPYPDCRAFNDFRQDIVTYLRPVKSARKGVVDRT
jgi:hypothetical protein